LGMKHAFALLLALPLFTAPALAAVDRETAVSTLAGLYNSADVCNLSISRAKVDAYRDANAPKNDAMFNVDVFRATHDLYDKQKNWTKDQTAAYCKTAAETARSLGMNL
jgi:hypothetical protein